MTSTDVFHDASIWVTPADEPVRALRSDSLRNRTAVVDALLDLFRSGVLQPSSNEIAERAGISPRSLFRYFDDIDDLVRAAIVRQLESCRPLVPIEIDRSADLATRIDALVDQRLRLFAHIEPVAIVSRLRSPFQPLITAQLRQGRAFLRQQLELLFVDELGAIAAAGTDGAGVRSVLGILDVVTSFESYQLLRHDQGLDVESIRSSLTRSLVQLLASPGSTVPAQEAT